MSVVPTTPELEAFYRESLEAIARIARKHGDTATVLNMIAVLGKAIGMMICACYPNERDLAQALAVENIDLAIRNHSEGEPSPMEKQ